MKKHTSADTAPGTTTSVEPETSGFDNTAPAEPATPEERIFQLEGLLAAKEVECRENWDRFLRERADMENYRKRANREKEELLNYGTKSMIEEIQPPNTVVQEFQKGYLLKERLLRPAMVSVSTTPK
jgi:molecular chaperone GrpE